MRASIAPAVRGGSIPYIQLKKQQGHKASVAFLVEMRGIEPLSENLLIQLSPGAGHLLVFSHTPPVIRLYVRATVLCMIGSTVKDRCMFTTTMTLSLGSWSFREERAVIIRPRHCHY